MYWDTPDRQIDPDNDPDLEAAFEAYLDSTEYLIDLGDAIEELIETNPSMFGEIILEQLMSTDLLRLMNHPETFGIELREDVERALTIQVQEDVENEWIEKYQEARRDAGIH